MPNNSTRPGLRTVNHARSVRDVIETQDNGQSTNEALNVGCEERPSNSIISTATYRNSYPKALSGLSVEHVMRPFAALPVYSGNDRRHTLTVSKSREKEYK